MDDDYTETYTGDRDGSTWVVAVERVKPKMTVLDALKEITQHLDAIAEVLHRLTEGEP